MADEKLIADQLIRMLHAAKYGGMVRKICTEAEPMPMAEKDQFRWSHPDGKVIKPFFNLVLCECPHCKLVFTCLPPETK